MDYHKLMAVSTAVIAFATALGVMFALVYYTFLMTDANLLVAVLLGIIYIDVILIFLYVLRFKQDEKK